MSQVRRHPHLYEINARVWLERLSRRYQRRITLSSVPKAELKRLSEAGMDFLWLMGVWERSLASRTIALNHPGLRSAYDRALPGWTEDDVQGSPYAVRRYALDPALGAPEELQVFKARLNRLNLGLILDFVTNHTAVDHPWTAEHPGRFVRAAPEAAARHPDWFFKAPSGDRLAHGRDPNFPPWTDTAQLDFWSPSLREAAEEELARIAAASDGVRCDMAMLALNRIFRSAWGEYASGTEPSEEYWPRLAARARKERPGFLLLAECYWNTEWELQEAGFDYTYDKTLYDRLRHSTGADVRGHLRAEPLFQRRSARFVENHDEPRALEAFGEERSSAAAAIAATVPGLRLHHDGQWEGRRVRLPIQLVREPEEPADPRAAAFYARLLRIANDPALHEGEWKLLEVLPTDGSEVQDVLAWSWKRAGDVKVVIVNYSPMPRKALARVDLDGSKTSMLPISLKGWEAAFL